jgi:hypothetical protein
MGKNGAVADMGVIETKYQLGVIFYLKTQIFDLIQPKCTRVKIGT